MASAAASLSLNPATRRGTARRPELAILLTTGYVPDHVEALGALPEGIELLHKPYGGVKLAEALARSAAPEAEE